MRMGHQWDFISDYGTDPAELAHPELKYLADIWHEQRGRLEKQEAFVRFNRRLLREWAIETGLIERLYALDRGVTQLLIEQGIDAALIPHGNGQHPESVASMIQDGRIARALATLVFVRAGWFPLVVRNDGREGYLDALEAADAGDLTGLVKYFANLQKDVHDRLELWQRTL